MANTKNSKKENLVEENNKKDIQKKYNCYFSYNKRIFLSSILSIIFFVLTIIFIPKSFNFTEQKMVNYQENSNLDYKVYLKENKFYETEYLEKDKIYIASLIDKITIDYNYYFNIDKKTNLNYNYQVIAKLSINDATTNATYFEKEYNLFNIKEEQMINETNYNIKKQVVIDYDYYNSLANNFKATYGIETTSKLNVYLKINNKNAENSNIKIDSNSLMLITIPLSEKAINIKMDYNEIDTSSYLLEDKSISLNNIMYILISITSLIITLIVSIKLIRLLSLLKNKKSTYDKYVSKIINEYDRLIVENFTGPDLTKNNIIKIKDFIELLDVRDNLKLPIMYYTVSKHQKCYFYIKHNEDIYLMTIKASDLEK